MSKDNFVRMRLSSEQLERWKKFGVEYGLDLSKLVRTSVEEFMDRTYETEWVSGKSRSQECVNEIADSRNRVEECPDSIPEQLNEIISLLKKTYEDS